jgi:predicted RNase H-like HicB family nuclease
MATTYQVELERDDAGWWVASVPAVPGAHTQGRSIAQAMNRLRQALTLWVDDAEGAQLRPVVHLPSPARAIVRRALTARRRAERAEQDASDIVQGAVRELAQRERLSTRDVAFLLELSPSRVDQLKRDRRAAPATTRVRRRVPATRRRSGS